MESLSRLVVRHKLWVALLWLAAVVAGVWATAGVGDRLKSDFGYPGREGYEANVEVLRQYGNGGHTSPVVPVVTLPEGASVTDPAVAPRLEAAFDALEERGLRVLSYPQTRDRAFLLDDGRGVYALVFTPPFGEDGPPAEVTDGISAALTNALPEGTSVRLTGLDQLAGGAEEEAEGDSGALVETLVGAGGALIVLLFVFGSALAFVPLLIAGVSVVTTFLAVSALTTVVDVVDVVQYIVGLIGLGVAIDYSLLLVTRWREERSAGADKVEATHRAMATAGRAVVFSGLTVAVGLVVLVLLPVPFMRSVGLGSVLIPLISVVAALTLLPVLLSTVGDRLDWPRLRKDAEAPRLWTRWAGGLARRPWLGVAAALAILLPLCAAALTMRLGDAPSGSLNQSGPARAALVSVTDGGAPTGVLTPIEVLVPAGTDPDAVADKLSIVDGVYRAYAPREWRGEESSLVSVLPEDESMTVDGRATVERVRDAAAAFSGVRVAGAGALLLTEIDAIYGTFPLMLVIIAVVTFLLLARAFRSVLLALQAIVLNLLSIGAAYGVLVLVWQEGYGSELFWGVPALGSVTMWVPLMTFAFLFGLSMDYQVFLLSRVREEYDATGSTRAAIVTGLGRVGRLVTSAALILFLAFVSLSAIPEVDVKVMATGLGAAILIDATVLRMLLVPAVTALTGRWTWWLPVGLARLLRVPPSPVGHAVEPVSPRESVNVR